MIHEPEVLAVAPEGEEPAAEEGRAPRWRDEEEDSEGEDLDEEVGPPGAAGARAAHRYPERAFDRCF